VFLKGINKGQVVVTIETKIGIIPARAGSKGLHQKNIRNFCGKPLLAWTIENALASRLFETVVVSTDCPEIQQVAIAHGAQAPFLRPENLATDSATSADVVLDVLDRFPNHKWLCLLQPTSPLRQVEDIIGSWELCCAKHAQATASVVRQAHPIEWALRKSDEGLLTPVDTENYRKRRQTLPDSYLPNGAIYWLNTALFMDCRDFMPAQTVGYVMSRERSVDIDDLSDFEFAEWLQTRK